MQPAQQRNGHPHDRTLIRANHKRGERVVRLSDGRLYVARPTLHALALVEQERGPISEVFERCSSVGGFCDTAAILECCTDGLVTRDDVLATGIETLVFVALELVATAFDERATKHARKSTESDRHEPDDGCLPVARMTGTAIAIWHVSPDAAWHMTVPEWWDAATVHIEANTPKDQGGTWSQLTEEEREELRSRSAEMPDQWPDQQEPEQ